MSLTYYRNKETGEIKPVEGDSPEMFNLQKEVGRTGEPKWEQTGFHHVEAIKDRAARGALHEPDLGLDDAERVRGVEVDTAEVGPEHEPWRNLTPGEVEAGLTPEDKRAHLQEMFAVDEEEAAQPFEEAADRIADDKARKAAKKEQKDSAKSQAEGLRARAGGSEENAEGGS